MYLDDMLPPVVISPPFGNYLNLNGTISVRGSYTLEPRPGLIRHTIKSLRPIPGGWVNRIGLRNPGIYNTKFKRGKIYSLAPLEPSDYPALYHHVPSDMMVEINLGCPNTEERVYQGSPHSLTTPLERFVKKFPFVSVKLPPVPIGKTLLGLAYKAGVRWFHMCNTIPTGQGGESGDRLRDISLEAIAWTRQHLPTDIKIIGGGGIYTPEHVRMYRDAGADHISISTACFKPWTISAIVKEARE